MCSRRSGSKQQTDDLDYWGAPDDMRPNIDADTFPVYEKNWDSIALFIRLQTQWQISPTGQRIGLIYSSINPVCEFMGIDATPEIFTDLQLMETAYTSECLK